MHIVVTPLFVAASHRNKAKAMTITRAREYAAEAYQRNKHEYCNCHRCIQAANDEKLQAVLNILANWPVKKMRRVK